MPFLKDHYEELKAPMLEILKTIPGLTICNCIYLENNPNRSVALFGLIDARRYDGPGIYVLEKGEDKAFIRYLEEEHENNSVADFINELATDTQIGILRATYKIHEYLIPEHGLLSYQCNYGHDTFFNTKGLHTFWDPVICAFNWDTFKVWCKDHMDLTDARLKSLDDLPNGIMHGDFSTAVNKLRDALSASLVSSFTTQ